MKKILVIFTLLFAIPICTLAIEPKVLTVITSSSGSTVNYEGTTEEGVVAVMCKIYDSKDEEVDILSVEVDENKFAGSFSSVPNGSYVVRCAKYEGGDIEEAKVVVNNTTNPNTNDAGILKSVIIFGVSIIGVISGIVYLIKRKKAQSQ